jgi:hypothetical protein
MKIAPGLLVAFAASLVLGVFLYPLHGEGQTRQAVLPEVAPEACPGPNSYAQKQGEELIACFGDPGVDQCYCLSRDKDGTVFKRWSTSEKCDAGDSRCKPRKAETR